MKFVVDEMPFWKAIVPSMMETNASQMGMNVYI